MNTRTLRHSLSRLLRTHRFTVPALAAAALATGAVAGGEPAADPPAPRAPGTAIAARSNLPVRVRVPGLPSVRQLRASEAPRRRAPIHARERRAIRRVWRARPFVSAGGSHRRQVALTFDDGPGPYTHRLVRILRRKRVPATFFQVGEMIPEFRGAAREVRRHFPVGDHTLSHPQMGHLRRRAQRWQVLAGAARLRAAGARRRPLMFRPPYASFDRDTFRVLRRQRMLMVLWNVDSEDYTRPGTRQIVRNVVSRVRPGSIVLMHDAGGDRSQTIAALPAIANRLRRRGYRFVTVPRMLLTAPPTRRQRLPRGAGT